MSSLLFRYVLPLLILLSGIFWFLLYRFLRRPGFRNISKTVVRLLVEAPGGVRKEFELPEGEILCGFSDKSDMDLGVFTRPAPGKGKILPDEIIFTPSGGRLNLESRSKVLLSGVETRTGRLQPGSFIRYGNCKITFSGMSECITVVRVPLERQAVTIRAAVPGVCTAAACILAFLWAGQSGLLPEISVPGSFFTEFEMPRIKIPEKTDLEIGMPESPEPEISVSPGPPDARPVDPGLVDIPDTSVVDPDPPDVPEMPAISPEPEKLPEMPAISPEPEKLPEMPAERPDPGKIPDQPIVSPEPVIPEKPLSERPNLIPGLAVIAPIPSLAVAGPEKPVPAGAAADVLFIHAHPDDESIDFGTLMALSRKAGLTTAVVLLTDGEGGIYQRNYTGPRGNMAVERVAEAARAIEILGSSYYVRFGFLNHPYNSRMDQLLPEEVLGVWGGKTAVAERIAEVIKAFRPAVVISPDGPSDAREHFEHEATGIAVREAIEMLQRAGGFYPAAHLASVDPKQRGFYNDLLAFPRREVLDIQQQALRAHQTQADAAVFGVQMIAEFDYEYYSVNYWRMDESPEIYFSP